MQRRARSRRVRAFCTCRAPAEHVAARLSCGVRRLMKYVARIRRVLRTDVHKVAQICDGVLTPVESLPTAERLEIEIESGATSCFMYRFTSAGEFCGDTWHVNLDDA